MSSPRKRIAALLAVGCAGILLGACGSGLYDAEGVPELEGGTGLVCAETQVVCGGVCTQEDASHCGESCVDCALAGEIPTGAVAACVRTGGQGTCGYECADGFLRCGNGCCPALQVAAGDRFTCALADDGSVSCWGANAGGQLGDGSTSARAVPGAVSSLSGATAIGAGGAHACAVVAGGAVRCWGANGAGQVTGSPSGSPALAHAASPVTAGAVAVAAGESHTCALLESGAVRCWGAQPQTGANGGTPISSGATAIAAGRAHTCALVGGAVLCWGENGSGQLGNGSTAASTSPVTAIGGGIRFVGAGRDQTCAATEVFTGESDADSPVRCWGDSLGAAFQLASPQLTPAVPMKDDEDAVVQDDVGLLAVGRKHVCIMDDTEAIECFGENDRGQLGGTPPHPSESFQVPLPASPPEPIASAISAGADHTCAIVAGGRLRCWGANDAGQLGDGSTADPGVGVIVTPRGR